MKQPMTIPSRLFRARPPDFFEGGIVAKYDEHNNIVTYDREFFDLRTCKDFGTLNQMTTGYLLATTEQ